MVRRNGKGNHYDNTNDTYKAHGGQADRAKVNGFGHGPTLKGAKDHCAKSDHGDKGQHDRHGATVFIVLEKSRGGVVPLQANLHPRGAFRRVLILLLLMRMMMPMVRMGRMMMMMTSAVIATAAMLFQPRSPSFGFVCPTHHHPTRFERHTLVHLRDEDGKHGNPKKDKNNRVPVENGRIGHFQMSVTALGFCLLDVRVRRLLTAGRKQRRMKKQLR
jgi:hypothetical protein